jgi:hypothetical protein
MEQCTEGDLAKVLDAFFTAPERLLPLLRETDKEVLIQYLVDILTRYANDVNSSALRELFTLLKAGYEPMPGKLGYNGKLPEGYPCDVKPINIRSGSGNKLNGGGNFSDFTYERLDRYLRDKVVMLVSGFVDGHLIYILEFPLSYLENVIRYQLDRHFKRKRRAGEYLRSAQFSFKHYKDSPDLEIIYRDARLESYRAFLTRNLPQFLRGGKE